MILVNLLTVVMKLEVFFVIFRKHLTLNDFLVNRKQMVALNGQVPSWANFKAGVPQGSIPYLYQ